MEAPEAILSIARPIHGESDLDELADRIAGKRFVLLGEATHGTHEFYDLRAALTRRLVAHHGFSAVCVESDWPDALRVDHYLRDISDDDDAHAALGSFERFPRWMWRNLEVLELVEWLHAHGHAGFYGLDLFSLHSSISVILAYLDENDPAAAARARERYACFERPAADPLGLGPRCETEVVAQLVEMQRRKIARSGRSPDGDAWFHAVQQAHVIRDAEAYYRTMFAGGHAWWNLRDTHMAETLDMVGAHLGGKMIVWSHNSHVGDARATEMGAGGQLSLGQLVRERHPNDCTLVGFTTYEGTVLASDHWDEPPRRHTVPPGLPASWEALFHEAACPRFYMTSSALDRAVGPRVDRLERTIGAVYRPDTLHARLADQFDVVIHVDTTRALDSLEPQEPAELEPRQTAPI